MGVKNPTDRLQLVYYLGCGIDKRGRDAAGYVSVASGQIRVAKKPGLWADAKLRFLENAARGDVCMAHARYATCGRAKQTNAHVDIIREAHPFIVKRPGKPTIYGAHNGVLWNGFEIAKKHGYDVRVDSEIIFELLADDKLDVLNQVEGYGVVSWICGDNPNEIKLCRLSDMSDLYAVRLEPNEDGSSNGIVYGSTKSIVNEAVEDAGLKIKNFFKLDKIGTVYLVRSDGIHESSVTNMKLSDFDSGDSWGNFSHSTYGHSIRKGYRHFVPVIGRYRVGSPQLGRSEYSDVWDDEFDNYVKEMEKKESESDALDNIIERFTPAEGSCQTIAPKCEQCACEVDENDIEANEYILQQVYGKKDVPILCSECLWDVDLSKTSGLSVG